MSSVDIWLLVIAAILVVIAGLFSSAEAAFASFSRARAEELLAEGRPGARRLVALLEDPPRYLNTALLLRMLCEIAAIVMVTVVMLDVLVVGGDADTGSRVTMMSVITTATRTMAPISQSSRRNSAVFT